MRHTHTSPGQKINLKNLLKKCLEKEVFVKNWTLTIKINNKESKSVTVNFVSTTDSNQFRYEKSKNDVSAKVYDEKSTLN